MPCSPIPTPTPESPERASPPSSPLSLSLDPASPQRDAPFSPPTLTLTPRVLVGPEQNDFVSDLKKGDSLEEEKENKEEKDLSKKLRVEALEDFAKGIIDCFTKLPESVCRLCAQGSENLKYHPIRRRDGVAALEGLAQKMLEWRTPDEALMQKKYAKDYNSLVNERRAAMKYHGLDVQCEE